MKHKWMLTLASVSAVSALPMVAVACGQENKYTHPKAPVESVTDIKLDAKYNLTDEAKASVKKIVMINDGGDINDKSFNQSAWEGLLTFANVQNKLPYDKYDVLEVKDEAYAQAYTAALNAGYNVWIVPGFLHSQHIGEFLKKPENLAKAKQLGIKMIGADYSLDLQGHGVFQNFKTKEAAFAAGYAAAAFLSNETNAADRTFASFGGGAFAGVTDFNEGFMKGVYHWNKKQTDENKKVHSTLATVNLGAGFDTAKPAMQSVIDSVMATNPKLILPVAGAATYQVMKASNYAGKYVIGVDTDQAFAAPSGKETFFTSILKNLGQSTYDAVSFLATTEITDANKATLGTAEANGDYNKDGGFAEKWVDISVTHIEEATKKALATKAIEDGKAAFLALSAEEKEWLYSGKAAIGGEEIADLQTRMNTLAEMLTKKNS
ncbi:BMP family ABC transporter substrate-binding protein [Mycoplasma simbae]|uniref:BMP family ABC transporter substrate-binding protein n=1 Tax=Mycoplasma simbae TaxID=36744 RepID=UPI0004959BE9|nr:BMP family ABC transporter substrate-binding protein [Mycoplasma simbae]